MTLLSELIDIPDAVHKSDFVINLASAVHDPAATVRDYVVTEQLADCFDRALSLVGSSVADGRSKSTYLHASFGSGKTAMMSVLHLLLQGDPTARAIPELASVVARHAHQIDGRTYLLVPYHFVGASSMEQVVLGGYVSHLRELHPDAPLPPVYVADGILADVPAKRAELGDELFLRILSEGEVADEWGDYGGGWDAPRLDTALTDPPGATEREELISALLRTHYRALPGQAQSTAEGFVPLEEGLDAISRHAKGLGYDAVVMLLDELVLWLASRMSDAAFVAREGEKLVKLVEADTANRPAPIVSFIARQRDLRELVGDHVPGAQSLSAIDVLRFSEGRFDTITLEDRNLPAIAARRLLRPRTEAATQQLDDAFEAARRDVEGRGERDVLLTETGDLDAFRRLYPFSPALVEALVALSGAMQRERTALKIMLQLLVEARDRLQVGELIPLGDLWDAIAAGDEPLTEVMRAQFTQARRLWAGRLAPMLAREHGVAEDDLDRLAPGHALHADARLLKTLLIAALVPEVPVLRRLTVSRLSALNSGVIRAFIPGTERQQVLQRLRRWEAEIGELRIEGDEQDPTVSLLLTGIDTGPLLDAARHVDSDGERRRRVRGLLADELQLKDPDSLYPHVEVMWRGFRRRVDMVFANVRDAAELPDEELRAGAQPKVIVDFPWDATGFGPNDDRARVTAYRSDHPAEWTAVWLPDFLTGDSDRKLGDLVRLEYLLTGDTFDSLATYLAPSDRPAARAQLDNQRSATLAQVRSTLRQAYGVEQAQPGVTQEQLTGADHFLTLDPSLDLRPPVDISLRSFLEGLADQLLGHRYPRHPRFTETVSRADLVVTLEQVTLALAEPGGRLENVEPTKRRVLTRTAGPLGVGTMHAAHFIADLGPWTDAFRRGRSAAGTATATVGAVRRWLDGAETPGGRCGLLPDVADTLILLVAEAEHLALVSGGQPVSRPTIGSLRDDWELRDQQLPPEAAWTEALDRAGAMGVVAASRQRAAAAVADLTARLDEALLGDRVDALHRLVPLLEGVAARFRVSPEADRLRTARAARRLVDDLHRQPERAPEILAGAEIPTTAAALGTAIATAVRVADGLSHANLDLIDVASRLEGEWAGDARAVTGRLAEALAADELVLSLIDRLGDATRAATDLLAQAARPAPTPPTAPVPPTVPTTEPAPPAPTDRLDRAAAEAELSRLRQRLRTEARLELTWALHPLPEEAGPGADHR